MISQQELETVRLAPQGEAAGPPLLFVHGGWHAAWCWQDRFMPYFAQRGYETWALSLRGHGSSSGADRLQKLGLADYVADVVSVLDRMPEKPVLVGHSMGGSVVQRVLAERQDLVRGAVLLSALPPSGYAGLNVALLRRWFRTGIRPVWRLMMFQNGRLRSCPQECFFAGDLPEKERQAYVSRLRPESRKAGREMARGFPPNPDVSLPVLVLGGEADWFFGPEVYARTAAAYDTKPVIVRGLGHNAMLDADWDVAAAEIHGFLLRELTR